MNEQFQGSIEKQWKDIEYLAVKRDFPAFWKKSWGLYYLLNPKKSKDPVKKAKECDELLSEEQKQGKLFEIQEERKRLRDKIRIF